MKYLLDTDTVIFWLNNNENTVNKVAKAGLSNIAISDISRAELYFGAYNSKRVRENLQVIHEMSETLCFLSFDEPSQILYVKFKARLKTEGKILDELDLMIAGIAARFQLTLVTNNTNHFKRIEELNLENWI